MPRCGGSGSDARSIKDRLRQAQQIPNSDDENHASLVASRQGNIKEAGRPITSDTIKESITTRSST